MAKGKEQKQKHSSKNAESSDNKEGKLLKRKDKKEKASIRQKGKHWTIGRDDLEAELAAVGLRVKQVVDYMKGQEEMFAPFVEDDESFGSYLSRMKKDGCWAGNLEIVAASNLLCCNIHVHQSGQPQWEFPEGGGCNQRALHISYHDGQHYNSVRNADDLTSGTPPHPLVFKTQNDEESSILGRHGLKVSEETDGITAEEIQKICKNCGCHDRELALEALKESRGNMDAAIEWVIETLSSQYEASEAEQVEAGGEVAEEVAEDSAPGLRKDINHDAGSGASRISESPTLNLGPIVDGYPDAVKIENKRATIDWTQEAGSSGNLSEAAEEGQLDSAIVRAGNAVGCIVQDEGADTLLGLSDVKDVSGTVKESNGCIIYDKQPPEADLAPNSVQKVQRHNAIPKGACIVYPQDSMCNTQEGTPKATTKLVSSRPVRVKKTKTANSVEKRPSRNKPCPCGSGRKYKDCSCSRMAVDSASGHSQSHAAHQTLSSTSVDSASKHLFTIRI
ncbi:hypothetical protein CEUSTIGMA_g10648.t1 [Chlamydomonas eustigma]|uniref:OTU domain-containing protein n=1 Tax=Chlamydomonas eustigma TaxID=1157962 RepID=A0A250XJX7_9CHLO|nr:hypothetical protein CEUSTIGMA_g10648.t1 [Chlamydomonas eustigma]|eukprot:GAX83222.1 hypothetical protein CEUSTIGMA_g10648.t1 [Chlamydomonas eustigma]